MKKSNLTSLSSFIDQEVGIKGTKKKDKYDAEYEVFKLTQLSTKHRRKNSFRSVLRMCLSRQRATVTE